MLKEGTSSRSYLRRFCFRALGGILDLLGGGDTATLMLRRHVCAQELLRAAKRLLAQVAAAVAGKTPLSASPGISKATARAGTLGQIGRAHV